MASARALRPIVIAAGHEVGLQLGALEDQAGFGLCAREVDRFIEQRLIGDDAARLDAAARRQDHLGLGIVEAGRKLVRREAAEDHRVDRADAGAGQHGDHRLRHHRHVEDDAIAFADAKVAQDRGERLHLGKHRLVGDGALRVSDGQVVDDGALAAAACGHMAIQCVEAGVALRADEPAAVDAGRRIEDLGRLLVPIDAFRHFGPEAERVAQRAGVDVVVAARADAGG